MRELRKRVAVITGAAGGIGAALAARLGQAGARLHLVDVRAQALDETAAALGQNFDVVSHVLDVTDAAAWQGLADEVDEAGGADLLVNNAGINVHGAFVDQSVADLDRIVDVNLRGVLYGCRAFLPQLRARPEAHLVNISSLAGGVPFPFQSTYCATKYAVRGLTGALRIELAGDGVGVTTVMPGAVATALLERATSYDGPATTKMAELMLAHGAAPHRVADRIVRAIRRNEAEVLIGWDARATTTAARMAPRLLERGLAAAFRHRRGT